MARSRVVAALRPESRRARASFRSDPQLGEPALGAGGSTARVGAGTGPRGQHRGARGHEVPGAVGARQRGRLCTAGRRRRAAASFQPPNRPAVRDLPGGHRGHTRAFAARPIITKSSTSTTSPVSRSTTSRPLARVVDEGLLAGAMHLAHRGLEPRAEVRVQIAKLAVLVGAAPAPSAARNTLLVLEP